MQLSNKVYDVLKWIALIVLPAIGTFYFALAGIWGLPYAEQVVGTVTAIDTLLGALIGVSTVSYNKAQTEVETEQAENTETETEPTEEAEKEE